MSTSVSTRMSTPSLSLPASLSTWCAHATCNSARPGVLKKFALTSHYFISSHNLLKILYCNHLYGRAFFFLTCEWRLCALTLTETSALFKYLFVPDTRNARLWLEVCLFSPARSGALPPHVAAMPSSWAVLQGTPEVFCHYTLTGSFVRAAQEPSLLVGVCVAGDVQNAVTFINYGWHLKPNITVRIQLSQ